jgi:hypothetical protein
MLIKQIYPKEFMLNISNITSDSFQCNVHINDGAAQFDGNAKLTLWGFMNKELGKKFAIRLRFKPDPTSTVRGSIISNCGMTGSPTVSIALENHQLKFSAKSMSFRRPIVIKDNNPSYI